MTVSEPKSACIKKYQQSLKEIYFTTVSNLNVFKLPNLNIFCTTWRERHKISTHITDPLPPKVHSKGFGYLAHLSQKK